ncbi:MAG: universal stress protein [Winogradskyella sp.]|uniref:universal stress protein n=1 Tax=Winogradskyella sp. TaxID=1883156 RepID=UPI0017E70498|nr:universal stress protein [Winogradskyella sp.]MBT8245863.1 universal stress protein [Winogradskyella sp.]NNK23066.1 universal stress protein [Winogradskyella sp.]
MKRKILLPTDFSKNSWHAINYALELYRSDDCDFFLLNVFSATGNVIKSLMNMEPGSGLYEQAKEKSEAGLNKMLDMLIIKIETQTNHHFTTISTFNNAVEAINNIVDEKDIDIIVMGTKGETASRTTIYGSTAVNVMEKVRHCPVIVVPERASLVMPKEIVFPTDYKIPFKRRELNHLIDIAIKTHATIQVLYIDEGQLGESQLKNKALLEEDFSDINYNFRELSNISVTAGITCFVESRESDMIAFINKKHLFFGSILNQALVKEIGNGAKVPILVMHDLKN